MHTNNSYEKPLYKQFHDFFVFINQINKHEAKIYNQCMYTQIIIKKFHDYVKNCFVLFHIRMINLSFDELRIIAHIRNMSDYKNKSKEDLIKAFRETAPKPEPKPQTPKPVPEIRVNKKKLKEFRKDFDKLRHKFLKNE